MSARRFIVHAACLAGLLALGLQVVYAVVVLWFAGVGSQLIPSRRTYETLQFLLDGTPVIVTHTPMEYQSRSARTLEGEPVELERLEYSAGGCSLAGRKGPRRPRRAWSERIRSYNDGKDPAIYWYLVHSGAPDGFAYLVGYDSKLKSLVGYIETGGFRSDKPAPGECFRVDGRRVSTGDHLADQVYYYYQAREPRSSYGHSPLEPIQSWMLYLVSGNRIVEIDVQRRTVRTVFESEQILSINLCRRNHPFDPDKPEQRKLKRSTYLAVRLADRIVVLDPHGAERRTYLLPEEIPGKGLYFREWDDETCIVECVRGPGRSPIDLFWIRDAEGSTRSESVALKQRPRTVVVSSRTVYLTGPRGVEDPRIVSALYGLVIPVPLVCATVTAVALPIAYLRSGKAGSYAGALATSFSDTWPGLLISLAFAAGAAWLCVRRQRQYAASWTRTWAVFVFVLGIPGLLGYWFHRRWPVRAACPQCGGEAPRDRESCFACGTEFPEPAPKGTEVFA
jgi:hypothetical protein